MRVLVDQSTFRAVYLDRPFQNSELSELKVLFFQAFRQKGAFQFGNRDLSLRFEIRSRWFSATVIGSFEPVWGRCGGQSFSRRCRDLPCVYHGPALGYFHSPLARLMRGRRKVPNTELQKKCKGCPGTFCRCHGTRPLPFLLSFYSSGAVPSPSQRSGSGWHMAGARSFFCRNPSKTVGRKIRGLKPTQFWGLCGTRKRVP